MIGTEVPPKFLRHYRGWAWSVAWDYDGVPTTWRLDHPSGLTRYLKVKRATATPRLMDEAARTIWLRAFLPVPLIVQVETEGGVDVLVTDAIPGLPATSEEVQRDREGLVRTLARGLRRFHQVPADDCPFRMSAMQAVALLKNRAQAGSIDSRCDFHPEHADLTVDDAIGRLEKVGSFDEDPVVCHGDYCLPNVLVAGGRVIGYLDLGELTVADRWWDLAIGSWSVTWNLGRGLEDHFYAEYGVAPDPQKIAFYRLLYDMIS